MKASYDSPYLCYCSKEKHLIGICIHWDNEAVSGYDCSYPYCAQDCQLMDERPVGFRLDYPKQTT